MTLKFKVFGRVAAGLVLALGLSACASVDTATRNAPYAPLETPTATAPAVQETYRVIRVEVEVPAALKVSEANRYYPSGDIVWRGDPAGERHEQVRAIVENALKIGAERVGGERPVVLKVEVTRFHALTEKARYTIGGVHAIQFYMWLTDAETGEMIGEKRFIKADFNALGGAAAVAAEARGVTQKVRITDHLARVIQLELTSPGSYAEHSNGILGAINQI